MAALSPTLFSRAISRRRSAGQLILFCLGLFALPFLAAAADGALDAVLASGAWRPMLLPSAILSYIVLVAPSQARGEADMLRRLRPSVLVDDARYAAVVAQASRLPPLGEAAAALLGAGLGFLLSRAWAFGDGFWLSLYLSVALPVMFGVLAWTIYVSLLSTRLLVALHREPLAIDLLDISPFESIGRQALISALVFLGGIFLGILFGFDLATITEWRTWVTYLPLALVIVLLFFLSMRDSHRALSAAKARELEQVGQRLRQVGGRFRERLPGGEIPAGEAAELAALLAYERRIRAAPTWPYNPSMLQTLLVSILLPILVKAITWLLFER